MNTLERSKLDWTLKHLLKESDTDLFPRPFEIDVLKRKWNQIAPNLETIDISSHRWRSPRVALVPKDGLSFRRAVQLDPIDALLFTGIIRTIGNKIERRRIPESQEMGFSYRYKPTSSGKFYSSSNAWERFWGKSRELARTHNFVAVTDIADFYNQIYHHTIKQELQQSGVESPFITAIDSLINTGTQTISRGLPVGPHGTHLLAEMPLIPTDEFLKLKQFTFCRYVDDYHIFCNSSEDAQVALFQLADTLDKTQKILLNRGKTNILTSGEFIKRADQMGEFQFGLTSGNTDYRITERGGLPAAEWTWEGMDEMDPCTGRGCAVLEGDELHGMIFFHQGDESGFVASKAKAQKRPKRK